MVFVAHVKVPPLGHENPLNKFIWTLDKNTIVEPIEEVKPSEDPLPHPTRLTLAKFDTFEYQPKKFEFDVLAIVINDRMTVLQQRQQLESDFKSSLSWRD